MRIVGGQWRGRALAPVGKGDAGAHLRPTTDRVRESLFNVLDHGAYPPLDGARVLDLFAGTGALGFEALSRGASHVTFVENGAVAGKIIRRNIDIFQCGSMVDVLRLDAATMGACKHPPYDIAFADPPYGKGLGAKALGAAIRGGWLKPGALVVLEEGAETDLPFVQIRDKRRYGDTVIHLGLVSETA